MWLSGIDSKLENHIELFILWVSWTLHFMMQT